MLPGNYVRHAVSAICSQRQIELRRLFHDLVQEKQTNLGPITLKELKKADQGSEEGRVTYSTLSTHFRTTNVIGREEVEPEPFGMWYIKSLSEVQFMEVFGHTQKQFSEDLRVDDDLDFFGFQAALVQTANEAVASCGPAGFIPMIEGASASDKTAIFLDYIGIPPDNDDLVVSPARSTMGSPMSVKSEVKFFNNGVRRFSQDPGNRTRRSSLTPSLTPKPSSPKLSRPSSAPLWPTQTAISRLKSSGLTIDISRPASPIKEQNRALDITPIRTEKRPRISLEQRRKEIVLRRAGGKPIPLAISALKEAIQVINPGDKDWKLTFKSVEDFLSHRMLLNPENCDMLRPGVLQDMFREADGDGDGTIDLQELNLCCASRFKWRRHDDRWKRIIEMANCIALAKRHHPPNVYLFPRIEYLPRTPPPKQRITAQYERPENYPTHCGYGPINRGEYITEELEAGVPARAKAWRSTLSHPARVRPSMYTEKCVGASVLCPEDIPGDYISPVVGVKLREMKGSTYPSSLNGRRSPVLSPGSSPLKSPGSWVSRTASPQIFQRAKGFRPYSHNEMLDLENNAG